VELKKIGEFGLINSIARLAPVAPSDIIRGIGDDAAVIALDKTRCLLFTTDTLIESIHFKTSFTSPYLLGKKSLAVNLSDIAAMGGTPHSFVVSLSIPPGVPYEFIKKFYAGIYAQAKKFNVSLVGGDTTASPDKLVITISLLGAARAGEVIYRHGAHAGDAIYVTGFLGDAALGLSMLMKKRAGPCVNWLIKRHLDPVPRVAQGREIARRSGASSMIDVSDGLLADLRHLLDESGVGARLRLDQVPLSRRYCQTLQRGCADYYNAALCGGEDYELLFTVPPGKLRTIAALQKSFSIPLTRIGEVTGKKGDLKIYDESGREVSYKREGFTHF
jgi:thiamine-monophosphate kinase